METSRHGSNRFADFDKKIAMKYFGVYWKRKIDDLVEDICEVR